MNSVFPLESRLDRIIKFLLQIIRERLPDYLQRNVLRVNLEIE